MAWTCVAYSSRLFTFSCSVCARRLGKNRRDNQTITERKGVKPTLVLVSVNASSFRGWGREVRKLRYCSKSKSVMQMPCSLPVEMVFHNRRMCGQNTGVRFILLQITVFSPVFSFFIKLCWFVIMVVLRPGKFCSRI